MKTMISIFAMALALAFTSPAFAGDVTAAKTKADCKKAGGMWDGKTNICGAKKERKNSGDEMPARDSAY
jgi:hypothetical protein